MTVVVDTRPVWASTRDNAADVDLNSFHDDASRQRRRLDVNRSLRRKLFYAETRKQYSLLNIIIIIIAMFFNTSLQTQLKNNPRHREQLQEITKRLAKITH